MKSFSRKPRGVVKGAAVLLALTLFSAACGANGGDEGNGAGGTDDPAAGENGAGDPGEPQSGGDLTVILDGGFGGGWDTGLDPATSSSVGANMSQNSAIFGGLFVLDANEDGEGELVANQAESYEYSDDGKTVTVTIREGIEFTDGTPFDADAVLWNWGRALSSGSVSTPVLRLDKSQGFDDNIDKSIVDDVVDSLDDVDKDEVEGNMSALRKVDDHTVQLLLDRPNGALINTFPATNMNLIASPSAYKEIGGEEFAQKPVGAGPFIVEANSISDRLELVQNDNYFKEGLPYLDKLTFQSIGGDQVMYQTLLAGQGDAIEGLSAVTLINEADENPDLVVTHGAPTSPYVVQLNTRKPPFDDKRAREAIYYASDFESINEGLFGGVGDMSQSFTASGGLFFMPEVEGYRTYDPEKAAEIVEELGGLTVELGTTDIVTARSVTTGLQSQWAEAGIDVTLKAEDLGDVITKFTSGDWEAMLQTAGAWEPAGGLGVAVRFGSTSAYSGTPLPDGADDAAQALEEGLTTEIDDILLDAAESVDEDERAELYEEAAKLISDEAWGPFGFAFSPAQVMREGVYGPGLSTPIPALVVNTSVLYDQVWTSN